MRELEGLSYGQIGQSLGMSKPVVESTLFRARRKLSEEYDELVTGRRCEQVQPVIGAEGERPLRSLGINERRLLARHLPTASPAGVTRAWPASTSRSSRLPASSARSRRCCRSRGCAADAVPRGASRSRRPAGHHSVGAVQSLGNAAACRSRGADRRARPRRRDGCRDRASRAPAVALSPALGGHSTMPARPRHPRVPGARQPRGNGARSTGPRAGTRIGARPFGGGHGGSS